MTRPEGREAFDLDREPAKVRDRYGRHPLGQNLLLARRMVEAGVRFVTVNGWTGQAPHDTAGPPSSSWDMHGGNMGMGNAFGDGSYGMGFCLPRLDQALAALLSDLKERGMLENTLVVVTGEFGRTPNVLDPGTRPAASTGPVVSPPSWPAAGIARRPGLWQVRQARRVRRPAIPFAPRNWRPPSTTPSTFRSTSRRTTAAFRAPSPRANR